MKVSVITPTYNRAHLLNNAFESLLRQTNKSFEWIIVDDGSSDNTESIVKKFMIDDRVEIQHFYKENGGKHTALNVGIEHATGDLSLILDSDDILTDDAIETIINDWSKYSSNPKICGLSYNRKLLNPPENIKKLKQHVYISNHIQFRYNAGHIADRSEVFRTEILKEYPFVVLGGEKFLSETIVWNKIALSYDTVYIDKDIYICEYLPNGLTANSIKTRINNPKGAIANYEIMMKKPFKLILRIKYAILYNTFCKFAGIPFEQRVKKENKFLVFITKILGDLVYLKWKKQVRVGEK